jgi:thiamine biosynthesis lipoprotein ApbE
LILESGTTSLTFDAIAKGYIIDQVTESVLKLQGLIGVVINIGGDLRVARTTPQQVTVSSPAWSWVIDFFAGLMTLVSSTGLF